MNKKFNYNRVEIIWYDICNAEGSWITEVEVLNHKLAECTTVGFLFSKNKSMVKLFSSWSYNLDGTIDYADVVAIPSAAVKSITVI